MLPSITLFFVAEKGVQRRAERKSNRIVTSFFIENRLQCRNFAGEQQNEMIVKYAQKRMDCFVGNLVFTIFASTFNEVLRLKLA